MLNNLSEIKDVSWEEAFDNWKSREMNPICRDDWIEVATKIKGWPDWESWRTYSANQFDAKNRKWKKFLINDPDTIIPNFQVGPFSGWQKDLPKTNTYTFKELIDLKPEYQTHSRILKILENFPQPTEIIGAYIPEKNRIVCLEGSHRCAAIALAQHFNKNIIWTVKPAIVLTEFKQGEAEILDSILKTGSSNPNAI
ncbi:hypothetical protein GF376_04855 [Candidatus Peregrinibacteria bacterium]|nr:hypothetical protein [Candidatus Peregrinibacteria bacterium]